VAGSASGDASRRAKGATEKQLEKTRLGKAAGGTLFYLFSLSSVIEQVLGT
jgi:hypothetical protein